ncbi:MAG: MBL fold metallo-hydrolase RNA specificity domain-containing protein, partial [Candidatus Parvarchaeum sp.]
MVKANNTAILLDAGVKLGKTEEYPVLDDKMLNKIDAIAITHAHLDHSGYLPHIYTAGYKGFAYMTKPTSELTAVLISDYMHISNPENVSKEGLKMLASHQKAQEYYKEFKIKGLQLRFIPAGHILGSAMVEIKDLSSGEVLLYTGDINLYKTKLFNGADVKDLHATTLITESTYGSSQDIFPNEREVISKFIKSLNETIDRGGKAIIPSFAVGRAQEVLLILDDFINSGKLRKVPLYVDGMINKAMRIHRHNVIYCRKELQSRILQSEYDPFKSSNFVPIEKKEERSKIVNEEQSSIIVTTSGMLTGGPVMYYTEKLAGKDTTKMLLVGYQAEGTLGRELQDGAKKININRKDINVEMEVEAYHMSAHADRKQLEELIGKVKGLENVFIIHGEKEKSE